MVGVPNPASRPHVEDTADDEMAYVPNPSLPPLPEPTADDETLEPASKELRCRLLQLSVSGGLWLAGKIAVGAGWSVGRGGSSH